MWQAAYCKLRSHTNDSFAIWFVWMADVGFGSKLSHFQSTLSLPVWLDGFSSNLIIAFHHVMRIFNGPVFRGPQRQWKITRFFGWWDNRSQLNEGNAKLFHITLFTPSAQFSHVFHEYTRFEAMARWRVTEIIPRTHRQEFIFQVRVFAYVAPIYFQFT